jgi:hypothetical protein
MKVAFFIWRQKRQTIFGKAEFDIGRDFGTLEVTTATVSFAEDNISEVMPLKTDRTENWDLPDVIQSETRVHVESFLDARQIHVGPPAYQCQWTGMRCSAKLGRIRELTRLLDLPPCRRSSYRLFQPGRLRRRTSWISS